MGAHSPWGLYERRLLSTERQQTSRLCRQTPRKTVFCTNDFRQRRYVVTTPALQAGGKTKNVIRCSECGAESLQMSGACKNCGVWNKLERREEIVESKSTVGSAGADAARRASLSSGNKPTVVGTGGTLNSLYSSKDRGGWISANERPQKLSHVAKSGSGTKRWPLHGDTGREISAVLGGGVVPGALTLIGGDPGVGKSTLLLQLADIITRPLKLPQNLVQPSSRILQANGSSEASETEESAAKPEESTSNESSVLYVSAEESADQVARRAERMGVADNDDIFIYSEVQLTKILHYIHALRPKAVIVDSIQTVYLDGVGGSAGSIVQVKECSVALRHAAHNLRTPIFLVGHVTKDSEIAGPRTLEHVVDTILFLEGERQLAYRLLRGIKNRHGATDELGVFTMNEQGLQAVKNPSMLFLSEREEGGVGASSAVSVIMNGNRPLLVEIQALCTESQRFGEKAFPRRTINGIDKVRLSQCEAVLQKQTGLKFNQCDVHLNVVGGMKLNNEPGADLAVSIALISSAQDKPVPFTMAFIGEIGLRGEIRPVVNIERRILEAHKLGFKSCIVPAGQKSSVSSNRITGLKVIGCRYINEAIQQAIGGS